MSLRPPSSNSFSRSRRAIRGAACATVAIAVASLVPAMAIAQSAGAPPAGGGGAGAGGAGGAAAAAAAGASQAGTTTTTVFTAPFGTGNPQSSNGTIGGGNATESSAHPITGDEEDSFDLGPKTGGAGEEDGSLHGGKGGPIFLVPQGAPTTGGTAPDTHLVRRGDTLWDICGHYFDNPYQWPRVWSYNPQIRNPHWIYPGDELRLKEGAALRGLAAAAGAGGPGDTALGPGGAGGAGGGAYSIKSRRYVPEQTIFLRDQGWLQDESDEVWGDITGSNREKMFLMPFDELYLGIKPGHDIKLGQELSVFRPRHTTASGMIIQILGTVRIDQWNPETRVARARVTEALDVIERGEVVGPIVRRYEVVPPKRNDADLQARVLASIHPILFYGENQLVFIDKGDAQGLKPGNRLFIVRRGDPWRRSLLIPGTGYRISTDDEKPLPPMERTPAPSRSEEKYPEETIGELRVLETKKDSSVCLVTQSSQEIEPYDVAVARKGY
jgi:hypothetical protein